MRHDSGTPAEPYSKVSRGWHRHCVWRQPGAGFFKTRGRCKIGRVSACPLGGPVLDASFPSREQAIPPSWRWVRCCLTLTPRRSVHDTRADCWNRGTFTSGFEAGAETARGAGVCGVPEIHKTRKFFSIADQRSLSTLIS
jgi:hypothetical protein